MQFYTVEPFFFLKIQAEWESNNQVPSTEWPSSGEIHFKNLSVRYKEGLPLVLRDVTATINPTEKVAISQKVHLTYLSFLKQG